jgi:hypothetical protein
MNNEIKDLYHPYRWVDGRGEQRMHMIPMRSSDILKMFGVGGANGNGPIPAGYEGGMWIGNTWVHIRASGAEGKTQHRRRVRAQCNVCGKMVCAGHLSQHKKIHRKEV